MDEDLSLCKCGREWCAFFNGGVGDYGQSYSAEEVKQFLDNLPKLEAHLRDELAKYEALKES